MHRGRRTSPTAAIMAQHLVDGSCCFHCVACADRAPSAKWRIDSSQAPNVCKAVRQSQRRCVPATSDPAAPQFPNTSLSTEAAANADVIMDWVDAT